MRNYQIFDSHHNDSSRHNDLNQTNDSTQLDLHIPFNYMTSTEPTNWTSFLSYIQDFRTLCFVLRNSNTRKCIAVIQFMKQDVMNCKLFYLRLSFNSSPLTLGLRTIRPPIALILAIPTLKFQFGANLVPPSISFNMGAVRYHMNFMLPLPRAL